MKEKIENTKKSKQNLTDDAAERLIEEATEGLLEDSDKKVEIGVGTDGKSIHAEVKIKF